LSNQIEIQSGSVLSSKHEAKLLRYQNRE
jgi:hypothetical protein